ncbi:MAG TPA: tetratricopeptide repeat protein [Pyrinomonadaceae bacterium]|jgi:Flp pilus assembly protein TadD|nr:tetratricopeptide repeat protein [Pyrinomonadaceae bacterium]
MSHSPAVSRLLLNLVSRCALAAALVALWCAPAAAQGGGSGTDSAGNGGKHSIRGRIYFPSGQRSDSGLKVRLVSTGFGDVTVLSDTNGSFNFQRLRPGSYSIIIEGGDNYETVQESVFIDGESSLARGPAVPSVPRPYSVQIYLQPKAPTEHLAKPGVLNAALAGVPKPAVELYNKALESARAGHDEKAVEQLRAAIEFHPGFGLALSKLGVIYMKMRQPEKALEPLRAALKLTPDDYPTLLTYGRALFDRGLFTEASEQFRKAAAKNAASPSAHFYLGLIALKGRDLDAAERELRETVRLGRGEIALAHKYLGGIYWGRQEYQRAADELETYLRLAPAAEDAPRLRATVKELRAKK